MRSPNPKWHLVLSVPFEDAYLPSCYGCRPRKLRVQGCGKRRRGFRNDWEREDSASELSSALTGEGSESSDV